MFEKILNALKKLLTPAMTPIEVGAALDGLAAANRQKLDWRVSIVDLMKLLDLDSSLEARKALAQEMGYDGALDGSAKMNLWLHQRVLAKVAEHSIKLPG